MNYKFFASSLLITMIFGGRSVDSDNTMYSSKKDSAALADSKNFAQLENIEPLFTVEGKAFLRNEMLAPDNWQANSRVLLDYGKYIGFIREDGQFIVEGVPSGSYIIEITNTDYIFEPLRIDITSKGKIRARKLNLLQPNAVSTLPYPLQIIARQPSKYFRTREEWRVTDVLMNPMVIMLLVAFLLLIVTPKLAAQDPQTHKDLQSMTMPNMDMPDMADMLASLFGGGSNAASGKKAIAGSSKRSTTSGSQSGTTRKNR